MDDSRSRDTAPGVRLRSPAWLALAAVALAPTLAGCSLFVMAGKVFFGDPQVTCAFRQQTGVDLAREKKRVLVVCTTPAAVGPELASLRYDLVELLTRRMKRAGIELVDSNKIAAWMDRNGGFFDHPSELASDFDADYIVHVDVRSFAYHEENSPTLYRGHVQGDVFAYAVAREGRSRTTAHQVFSNTFTSQYPEHAPKAAVDISSERVFVRRCVDRLSIQLAQLFHDHPMSERIH
ncbi:MAG TPA: hypothetical protein VML55_25620 [Planctomycetaceae bacterium]|nr:hypothetical protein [Planctomycetaceae bacterium]